MLHVLLIILKVIGIILTVALGIILVSLLCILFVPVRYKIEAKKKEDICARGRISWLCSVLLIKMLYEKEKLGIQLRVFGYCIYDSDSEKRIRKRNKKSVKKKKKTKKANKRKDNKQKNNKRIEDKQNKKKQIKEKQIREKQVAIKKEKQIEEPKDNMNGWHKQEKSSLIAKDRIIQSRVKLDGTVTDDEGNDLKIDIDIIKDNDILKDNNRIDDNIEIVDDVRIDETILDKIQNKINNLKNKWNSFLEKLKHIKNAIKNIWAKFSEILKFLKDEQNKAGLLRGFQSLRKLLKHLYPKKLKLQLKYGTGDPCSTGQILAILSMLYPVYSGNIQVVPCFEEQILEFNLEALGRIRIISLLIICIKLIRDKNFKYLIKSIQKIKEEL